MSSERADTGFDYHYGDGLVMSDIGPVVLSVFAFFIFAQALIYLVRPEMTGRSIDTPIPKLRRLGLYLSILSGGLLYVAFSWWIGSWSVDPRQVSP